MLRTDQVLRDMRLLASEEISELQDTFCENLEGCESEGFAPESPESRACSFVSEYELVRGR